MDRPIARFVGIGWRFSFDPSPGAGINVVMVNIGTVVDELVGGGGVVDEGPWGTSHRCTGDGRSLSLAISVSITVVAFSHTFHSVPSVPLFPCFPSAYRRMIRSL